MIDTTDKATSRLLLERRRRVLLRGDPRDEHLGPVGDTAGGLPRSGNADIERAAKDSRPGGPSRVEDFRRALLGEDNRTRQCRSEDSGRSGGVGGERSFHPQDDNRQLPIAQERNWGAKWRRSARIRMCPCYPGFSLLDDRAGPALSPNTANGGAP